LRRDSGIAGQTRGGIGPACRQRQVVLEFFVSFLFKQKRKELKQGLDSIEIIGAHDLNALFNYLIRLNHFLNRQQQFLMMLHFPMLDILRLRY
jgi:hypothetical protein